MDNITHFDVLVVYNEHSVMSAHSISHNEVKPFSKGTNDSYNIVYGYFLETCKKHNLSAAFASSADIIGSGTCSSYWTFEDGIWKKFGDIASSNFIFDKFSPKRIISRQRREILFSSKEVKSFNDPYLFNLFFDKHKTYKTLKHFAIPTVTLYSNSRHGVLSALKRIKSLSDKSKYKEDFAPAIILKDRFGAGGNNVYKFSLNQRDKIVSVVTKKKNISFIMQPFIAFDKGFSINASPASTDIRLIFHGKRIIQTYTRTAQSGNFLCNEHAGGRLNYNAIKDIPNKVVMASQDIAKILNKRFSIYALDFIISNNGNVYLLEANTGPGLDWNLDLKKNEFEAKRFIRMIVSEIERRTKRSRSKSYTNETISIRYTDEFPIKENLVVSV